MKILIATEFEGIVGGVETYLRALLPALQKVGHELALFTTFSAAPNSSTITEFCSPITHISMSDEPVETCLTRLERWNPEVCYLQGLSDPEVEAKFVALFPTVFYAHNYYGTCISGTKRFGRPSPRPCTRKFGAACLTQYFPKRCGGLNPRTMWQQFRIQSRRNRLLKKYDRVAVASRHMADEMLRHGVPQERLIQLPLFPTEQTPDPFPPAPRPSTNRLLTIGRLTELKGTHLLIEAFGEIRRRLAKPIELIVAGDGPERDRLESLSERLGLGVHFAGWVDRTERLSLMRSCDLLVLPGTWPEPFGLVGIEAGCVGLPAVAFDVGGISDWCRDGVSGVLASGSNPCGSDLVDVVVKALADPVRHQSLRVGAWRTAQEYTPGHHLAKLEAEWKRVIDNHRRQRDVDFQIEVAL